MHKHTPTHIRTYPLRYLNLVYLEGLEELLDIVSIAFDAEGDHSTESFSQGLGHVVVGMGGQARVHDLSDVWGRLQQLSHGHGIALVLSHAHMESLQTSVGKETVKGTRDTARRWEIELVEIEKQDENCDGNEVEVK